MFDEDSFSGKSLITFPIFSTREPLFLLASGKSRFVDFIKISVIQIVQSYPILRNRIAMFLDSTKSVRKSLHTL